MKTLKECRPGDRVTVVNVKGTGATRRRILDMGVTRGISILVRKVAPLGDPMEINLRGFELTLRKKEAEMIEVEDAQFAGKKREQL